MNLATLARRSLAHHARAHLGAILGAAVGAAVLTGALVVGDSVRESLRQMALARLGKTGAALAANDRFFRDTLADSVEQETGAPAAAVLQLAGTAANSDGTARANRVQVLGVAPDFWDFSHTCTMSDVAADAVALNEPLARQLGVQIGGTVLLRVQKPSRLSQDAPLAASEKTVAALRLTVRHIVSDADFGRFGLAASQLPPFNAFVNRTLLQQRAEVTNRANLLLSAATNTAALDRAIKTQWQAADAELEFRVTPDARHIELRTSRVFLDEVVTAAALRARADAATVLTYFVNELKAGDRTTPYSMVTATGADLAPGEIKINEWLAEDLAAKPGDSIELAYYVVGPLRQLTEERASFRVHSILPLSGADADRSLMPDFPGLTDADNCRDWDTGFPIKTDAIRDKDEKYWDDHRGTPKAFINLADGQRLWNSRFGNATSIRWPVPPGMDAANLRGEVEKTVLQTLEPAAVGLVFEPVRARALAASVQGQDFGQLFLGFSMFLIAAALMLVSLLFGFGIEQRASEMGTLLAIGFTPKQVRCLLLFEGFGLALIGTALGAFGGVFYAKAMLHGLSTIWRDAVGTSALSAHVFPATVLVGAALSMKIATATMAWAIRREGRRPARELLAAAGSESPANSEGKSLLLAKAVFFTALLGAVGLTAAGLLGTGNANAGLFFGAGALLLTAAVSGVSLWMRVRNQAAHSTLDSLFALGSRNLARRPKRSRAVIVLLGSGAFIVASIGIFRLDAGGETAVRTSGTGGFAFIGESALPVVHDLNAPAGREFHGLDAKQLDQVQVVPLRVRAGDDASCLNLNRAQKPRLVGVDPKFLASRGAFRFSSTVEKTDNPWLLLEKEPRPNVIPAIGDAASIQWALGKKVGDTLAYQDERGQTFEIEIVAAAANSILQGMLVISEKHFIQRFPTESGYRMFLIDAPSNRAEQAAREMTRALQDYGLETTPAAERLAAFNAVQNTYLNTFQVLGGLGLLLGSFGLGVVLLRNVFERRAELALLQAVGFTPGRIRRLILGEHAGLLLAGLLAGAAAALVAVLPTLLQPRGDFPAASMLWTLGGVLLFGLAATWLAASLALRGNLLNSLRSE